MSQRHQYLTLHILHRVTQQHSSEETFESPGLGLTTPDLRSGVLRPSAKHCRVCQFVRDVAIMECAVKRLISGEAEQWSLVIHFKECRPLLFANCVDV